MSIIGRRIARLRAEKNWSRERLLNELNEQFGASLSMRGLAYIEEGEKIPRFDNAVLLIATLKECSHERTSDILESFMFGNEPVECFLRD